MNTRNDIQKQNGIHLALFGLANKLGGTCSFLPLQNDFRKISGSGFKIQNNYLTSGIKYDR